MYLLEGVSVSGCNVSTIESVSVSECNVHIRSVFEWV